MSCGFPFSWPLRVLPSLLMSYMCMAKNWSSKDLCTAKHYIWLVFFCFFFSRLSCFWQENDRKNWIVSVWEIIFYFQDKWEKMLPVSPNNALTGTFLPKPLHLLAMKHKAHQIFLAIHPNPDQNWWVQISLNFLANTHSMSVFLEREKHSTLSRRWRKPLSSYSTLLSCSCMG